MGSLRKREMDRKYRENLAGAGRESADWPLDRERYFITAWSISYLDGHDVMRYNL